MIGIVLAAGAGRRLRPYTDALPKALLPVDGEKTILDIALSNLSAVGLEEVVVVVGYAAEAVEKSVDDLEDRHRVHLTLVHNDKAEVWNNAYSLWLARDLFNDGALVVNGDTVHPPSVERALLADRGDCHLGLAVDTGKRLADEEMKVAVGDDGRLRRITKEMPPHAAYGEYIGVTLIEPQGAPLLAEALQATWEENPDLYYEDGFQEMVNRGAVICTTPIPRDTAWVEVDNHADLETARIIACRY